MRLGQIRLRGQITAAIFGGSEARPIIGYSLRGAIERAEALGESLAEFAGLVTVGEPVKAEPLIPIHPAEVWGCGCTYQSSAAFRDAEHGTREGFYAGVYNGARPEVFFKGTSRVCVGPGDAIGIRSDSSFTAPEPELALLLGSKGQILGYMLANDVSAWDIERENPLYLPQSKTFSGCCALGPVIVTPDEIADPRGIEIRCRITRGGVEIFSGEASTARLNRSFGTLIEFLFRSNPVPAGTVLLTGTGIIVTEDAALRDGDVVSISAPGIGELTNPASVVS